MDQGTLIIHINWVYFLGIVGSLIAAGWYMSGRLTKIEASIEWLKEQFRNLEHRFYGFEDRFRDLDNRFQGLESKFQKPQK